MLDVSGHKLVKGNLTLTLQNKKIDVLYYRLHRRHRCPLPASNQYLQSSSSPSPRRLQSMSHIGLPTQQPRECPNFDATSALRLDPSGHNAGYCLRGLTQAGAREWAHRHRPRATTSSHSPTSIYPTSLLRSASCAAIAAPMREASVAALAAPARPYHHVGRLHARPQLPPARRQEVGDRSSA